MNAKLLNLILTGSILMWVILVECNKNDDNPPGIETTNETGTFTDNRDGKIYKWVKIGTQVWMAENISYTGNDIQLITDGYDWRHNTSYDGWCYYENNSNYGNTYGVLYQYEAALKACPEGWHIPSDEEWTQLENYLKENGYSYDGVIGNNGIAKALATDYDWNFSYITGSVGNTDFSDFRNKTGFSALPAGIRSYFGSFNYKNRYTHFWSTTENGRFAWGRKLYYQYADVRRELNDKTNGISVRCIKD